MCSATAEEPTKPIALMRGSLNSVSTASRPPLTTLSTPAGSPASITNGRRRELPHRNHGREVEGRDAGHDPERLAHGVEVDAGAGAFGELALDEVGNAAGELGDLETALDIAARIRQRLAVLAGEEPGEPVEFPLHQLEKLEQHARAPLRVGGGPGRLGCLRHRDRALDLGGIRIVDL